MASYPASRVPDSIVTVEQLVVNAIAAYQSTVGNNGYQAVIGQGNTSPFCVWSITQIADGSYMFEFRGGIKMDDDVLTDATVKGWMKALPTTGGNVSDAYLDPL